MPTIPIAERLWWYVLPNDTTGCWEWTGSMNGTGYGRLSHAGRTVLAHRAAYALCRGDVGRAFVMHSCDNRKCVNPWHLSLGSHQDNMTDMTAKGRARHPSPRADQAMCRAGRHPWIPENMEAKVTRPHGTLKRSCRECHLEARARRYVRAQALKGKSVIPRRSAGAA